MAGDAGNQISREGLAALEAELAALLDERLARKVIRNLDDHRRLAERDARNAGALREQLGRRPMIEVPELPGDVHDLAGLAAVNAHLFDGWRRGRAGLQTGAE